MSLSFAVLLYEVEYKKLESKFNKNQFCGIINSSFYARKGTYENRSFFE